MVIRDGFLDTCIPEPAGSELKWTPPRKPPRDTKDERRFHKKHYEDHVKEGDKEFTEKIVLAPPRDVPGEPELWRELSSPRTGPKVVRRICHESRVLKSWFGQTPSNPLYLHAREFCRAKRDDRCPDGGKQNRRSSDDKRLDYLARVMAGLSLRKPMAPATAEDILRKMKHKRRCPCWRCWVKRTETVSQV